MKWKKIEREHCEEKYCKLQEEIERWKVKCNNLIEDLVNAKNTIAEKIQNCSDFMNTPSQLFKSSGISCML